MTREEARALADRVLALSKADQTRVNITSEWGGNTRFADASITTSGGSPRLRTVTVTIACKGAATTNARRRGLRRTVELAAHCALRPHAELCQSIAAYSRSTHIGTPPTEPLAAPARGAGRAARLPDLLRISRAHHASESPTATFFRLSPANVRELSYDADSRGHCSGWAARVPTGRRRPAALVAWARKAQASKSTGDRGRPHTAVLEPQGVNDLVPLLAGALNARSADEGRSAFSKAGGGTRIGEKVCDERVTLYTDPSDPDLLGMPFDVEGLPIRRTE